MVTIGDLLAIRWRVYKHIVYVVRIDTNILYIGRTSNVGQRFRQHLTGGTAFSNYLSHNLPNSLMWTVDLYSGTKDEVLRGEIILIQMYSPQFNKHGTGARKALLPEQELRPSYKVNYGSLPVDIPPLSSVLPPAEVHQASKPRLMVGPEWHRIVGGRKIGGSGGMTYAQAELEFSNG